MNGLTAFFKKLRLRQIFSVFVAGLLLIVTTACGNAENAQGAKPNNPPVQAGGANNPYKGGGDKYTDLKMSKTGRDQASRELNSQLIIATNKESELLYPGAETPEGKINKEAELPIKTLKNIEQPQPGGLNQRQPNVGTRLQERIETVKEAVEEASEFLQEKSDEAGARPELRPNPAVKR